MILCIATKITKNKTYPMLIIDTSCRGCLKWHSQFGHLIRDVMIDFIAALGAKMTERKRPTFSPEFRLETAQLVELTKSS
jgi:hypothetical protein